MTIQGSSIFSTSTAKVKRTINEDKNNQETMGYARAHSFSNLLEEVSLGKYNNQLLEGFYYAKLHPRDFYVYLGPDMPELKLFKNDVVRRVAYNDERGWVVPESLKSDIPPNHFVLYRVTENKLTFDKLAYLPKSMRDEPYFAELFPVKLQETGRFTKLDDMVFFRDIPLRYITDGNHACFVTERLASAGLIARVTYEGAGQVVLEINYLENNDLMPSRDLYCDYPVNKFKGMLSLDYMDLYLEEVGLLGN